MNGVNNTLKEHNCGVDYITLNSPETGNTVNNENLITLNNLIKESLEDSRVRIIVIKGSNGVFCKGMDFNKAVNQEIDENWARPYIDLIKTIINSGKIFISAVDGEVIAGGMGLMLSCDIIISSEKSVFSFSEVLFGLIPAMVMPLLLNRVNIRKAVYLTASSVKINAEEALRIGIIDELANNGEPIEKKLKQLLKRLLFSSPDALKLAKHYPNELSGNNLSEKLETGLIKITELLNDSANINAIKNYMNGELPEWCISYRSRK